MLIVCIFFALQMSSSVDPFGTHLITFCDKMSSSLSFLSQATKTGALPGGWLSARPTISWRPAIRWRDHFMETNFFTKLDKNKNCSCLCGAVFSSEVITFFLKKRHWSIFNFSNGLVYFFAEFRYIKSNLIIIRT